MPALGQGTRRAMRLAVGCLAAFAIPTIFAQRRRVAITFDDLPYASGGATVFSLSEEQAMAMLVNGKLLAALQRHHAPATAFVIQNRVESLGLPVGTGILKAWIGHQIDDGSVRASFRRTLIGRRYHRTAKVRFDHVCPTAICTGQGPFLSSAKCGTL
jgi:hypothetical protein